MKKILLAAAVAALASTSALAADLPARTYKAPPVYVPPAYNWTGFYIGAHLGGAFGGNDSFNSNFLPGTFATSKNSSSFLGGGQVGADYQFNPNWLIGIEGQISGLTNNDRRFTDTVGGGILRDRSNWLASVTGRLGYVWGPGVIYAKGGVAFRDSSNLSALNLGPGDVVTTDRNDVGYTVGGGVEYMFAPAWSAKIEYQYYNFNRTNVSTLLAPIAFPSGTAFNFVDDVHTVKVGLNYHFNWGSSPVLAKY